MTSTALERNLVSQDMHVALLWVIEFSHDDVTNDLRLVNNTKDITISGKTYTAMPFDVTFDPDNTDGNSQLQIKFSNVDQRVGTFFRGLASPASATVKIISSDSKTVTQAEWPQLRCRNVVETREVVAVGFDTHQLSASKFPPHAFTPDMFPGAFK